MQFFRLKLFLKVQKPSQFFQLAALLFLHGCSVNPDLPQANTSRVLEFNIVAEARQVDLNGDGLLANAYTYNGGIPGPDIRLNVGDTAIVRFTNNLQEPQNIHWHGIELDNANDGTTVTQNPVQSGETYIYKFIATRPGVFWYHPHAMPTNFEFKGLYGAIVITDKNDQNLVNDGILPSAEKTHTLMLSDITVCKQPGQNDSVTFPPDPNLPWEFSESISSFPGLTAYPSPADLCDNPRDLEGKPLNSGPLNSGDIPNIMPSKNCRPGGITPGIKNDCRVNEGQLVLANGKVPAAREGSPMKPGELTGSNAVIDVKQGDGVRLQIINAAVSRYFWLRMTDQNGKPIALYRVGGEGGLIDRVRTEGGMQGLLDTKFNEGEIVLGVADRTDVVFVVPNAKLGETLTLWTLDFQRYGTTQYPFGYGGLPSTPVAHFKITEKSDSKSSFEINEGDPLLLHSEINDPVSSIRTSLIKDKLIDPTELEIPLVGTESDEILLTVVGLKESIDGIYGTPLESIDGDYRDIPFIPTSRFAYLGDTLELTINNGTQMHHPLHLHGFSYQPIRLLDSEDNLLYEYDYNEFVDTVDIPALSKLVFRVHLEDRPVFSTGSPGGGAGRWLLHCHIFNHAALGMISELVVLDKTSATLNSTPKHNH
ncbi:MAG: multicopper oxidase family protein [Pseudomonadota bacterium]|nr:multicopper oxidase family protein [Pseudomonadota bacterium]